ncbi:MAG: beta-lactamase family protein, partial [Caulobacterales bacterium]|nr:beta-lactamase family protein [Caulobacterales bacterium]
MFRTNAKSMSKLGKRLVAGMGWLALLLAAAIASRAARADDGAGYVDRFERRLDAAVQTGDFVGLAVAVVDGGDLSLLKVYGETAVGGGEPIEINTAFRLASVSKGFATTLVAQLAEEGRLDWDDRLVDHAPQFKLKSGSATRAVTLEHVASHRVGLPGHAYDNWLEEGDSVARILQRTSGLDLVCQPGDCYGYQNIVFSLLGEVVEGAEGRPFDDVVSERLFEPLGMYHASVGRRALMSSRSWARPHKRRSRSSPWRAFT